MELNDFFNQVELLQLALYADDKSGAIEEFNKLKDFFIAYDLLECLECEGKGVIKGSGCIECNTSGVVFE